MTTSLPQAAIATSHVTHGGADYWLEREAGTTTLVVTSDDEAAYAGFAGSPDNGTFRAPTTGDNALALRRALPWLTPVKRGIATSAGTGDRLGICTPGHAAAFQEVGGGINPVFAQQSIREMGRTHRQPRDVLDDATWGAFRPGWTGTVGADADHLKTTDDIDRCAEAGFVFYTIDPCDDLDLDAETTDLGVLKAKADAIDWASFETTQADALRYIGRTLDLESGPLVLDELAVLRTFGKFGPCLGQGLTMWRHLVDSGIDFEAEFAVDEALALTRPEEHAVIMLELKRLGVDVVSFAPKFVGRFEKGVEFIGDSQELADDFRVHAEIARALGPYKLSLHSGSDKYSTYPLIAEATRGVVHLKTAGTSWAESLRIIARHDPELTREMLALAIDSYETNKKSYHLSCDPARVPTDLPDDRLDDLLTLIDSRQVLHVAYGAILDAYKPRLMKVWQEHDAELQDVVKEHFVKHLAPFAH